MSIEFDNGKMETLKLCPEGFERTTEFCSTNLAEAVVVNDNAKVAQAQVAGHHEGLPVRALMHFTVTQDDKDAARKLFGSQSERHSDCDRQAVPQCTRGM